MPHRKRLKKFKEKTKFILALKTTRLYSQSHLNKRNKEITMYGKTTKKVAKKAKVAKKVTKKK
jgi:hypothetical protein